MVEAAEQERAPVEMGQASHFPEIKEKSPVQAVQVAPSAEQAPQLAPTLVASHLVQTPSFK
jgi:hypothetical protein